MLGVVCGFETEAKVARLLTPLVACSGALENVATKRTEELVRQGATALLSFGLAGGLAPHLKPGTVLIGTHVIDAGGHKWICDETMMALLMRALALPEKGGVFGSKVLMPGPAEKRPLYEKTGCVMVDMESQVVAAVAARHKLPFGVLRGISDTVDETFPDAALVGIKPDGSINLPATLKSILKNPSQLPALLRLFSNTRLVLNNLKSVAPALGDWVRQV